MNIKLSDHFTYGRLIRFALPSIVMMIFTSIYSVVDGLFVSNLAGKDALAAVNLAFPMVMIFGCVGFMFGTGGAALVAKTLGEGDKERAGRLFGFIVVAAAVVAAALACVGWFVLPQVMVLIGATDTLLDMATTYGRILFLALPAYVIQMVSQSFFIASEKPHIGLGVTLGAGVTNIVLDYVFIAMFGWGIEGAALATIAGQIVAAVASLAYFVTHRDDRLAIDKPLFDLRALGKVCVNGSSELMTEVAAAIVGTLYNYQLMQLAGADGVAAYGVIMYMNFVFVAIFFGFSMGTGPIISYQYGAKDTAELKNLFKKSLTLVGITGVVMFASSQLFAPLLAQVFVGYDPALAQMTIHGYRIYSGAYLICGFNIFGSAFFTALNNGLVSALISFMRTLIFETSTVMLLPIWWGIDGVWCAIIVAESCALVLTLSFMFGLRKVYHYA